MAEAPDYKRCRISGNPVGTDTRMIGVECDCISCVFYAAIHRIEAATTDDLKAELNKCGYFPERKVVTPHNAHCAEVVEA